MQTITLCTVGVFSTTTIVSPSTPPKPSSRDRGRAVRAQPLAVGRVDPGARDDAGAVLRADVVLVRSTTASIASVETSPFSTRSASSAAARTRRRRGRDRGRGSRRLQVASRTGRAAPSSAARRSARTGRPSANETRRRARPARRTARCRAAGGAADRVDHALGAAHVARAAGMPRVAHRRTRTRSPGANRVSRGLAERAHRRDRRAVALRLLRDPSSAAVALPSRSRSTHASTSPGAIVPLREQPLLGAPEPALVVRGAQVVLRVHLLPDRAPAAAAEPLDPDERRDRERPRLPGLVVHRVRARADDRPEPVHAAHVVDAVDGATISRSPHRSSEAWSARRVRQRLPYLREMSLQLGHAGEIRLALQVASQLALAQVQEQLGARAPRDPLLRGTCVELGL